MIISLLIPPSQVYAQCAKGDCNNGTGTYLFKSGAKFIGEFKEKQMSFGVYHYPNNDIYKGPYQNNKREGEGEYFYASGNYFKGTYSNGKKINGIFKYVDGSTYDGDFYNDKKNGKGTLTTAAGESYIGYWKNDKYIGEEVDNPVVVYALIVAIADYKNGNDLTFTVNDARKFNDFILSGAMGGDETQIEMLLNQQASKGNILRIMDELFSKADKNDSVILFFSGHGSKNVFIPYDCIHNNAESYLYHDEVKAIYKNSKSQHKLLIADACFAGSLKEYDKDDETLLLSSETSKSEKEVEVAIMLSCTENEVSREYGKLGQGVFSYFLLKGLSGEADVNFDKIVTIEEAYYYVRNNTYQFVKENSGESQRPILFGKFDRNMPVSIVD